MSGNNLNKNGTIIQTWERQSRHAIMHGNQAWLHHSCLRLRLRPQPRPGPGQIDAKVEIMNEKLTTVGTIMSSESYNYIIHVLLSATLFFAYRLRRIFCRCNNVNDNGNDIMAIMHIIRTARATGVRLAVRLPPACLHDDGWWRHAWQHVWDLGLVLQSVTHTCQSWPRTVKVELF